MDSNDLEIDIIPSPNDPCVGAHVGVRIRHKMLDLTAESTSKRTQYANKLNAMDMLKMQLMVAETVRLVPPTT
jgi:protein subunit release factor A